MKPTLLAFAVFLLILVLGAAGWMAWLATAENPIVAGGGLNGPLIAESLYRSLQLFVWEFNGAPYGVRGALNTAPNAMLQFMRFMAPTFTVVAIILALLASFRRYLFALWRGLRARKSFLILGYGAVGHGIAEALMAAGPRGRVRIVAADRSVTAMDRREAARQGVELFEADARDPSSVAALPIRARKVDRTIIALGDDATVVAAAAAQRRALQQKPGALCIHLLDRALCDRFRDPPAGRAPQAQIKTFNMDDAAAECLLDVSRPALNARACGSNRIHAVVVGFDSCAWAAMESIVLNGQFPPPTFARPRFSVIAADAVSAERQWRARHPRLDRWAIFTFINEDPSCLAWTDACAVLDGIEVMDPPTLYIVAPSIRSPLALALSLRLGMEKGLRARAQVCVLSRAGAPPGFDAAAAAADLQDRLHIIGRPAEVAAYSMPVDTELDRLARAFHHAYGGKPPYDELPETLQASNRRAALHSVEKLRFLGFEQANPLLPAFGLSPRAVRLLQASVRDDGERLGGLEHARWCVDRTMDGWTPGPRDEETRRRGQLEFGPEQYAALGAAERRKDSDQLMTLVRALEAGSGKGALGGTGCDRFLDYDCEVAPQWTLESSLTLDFAISPDWRRFEAAEPGVVGRVRIRIPPEPPLDPGETPADRAAARRAAYREFARSLTDRCPSLHFRLLRVAAQGWNWLGAVDQPRVDGATLPPLTLGFAGHRDLWPYGPAADVTLRLCSLLQRQIAQLREEGRPLRLITGMADGADQLMIDAWTASGAGPLLGVCVDADEATKNAGRGAHVIETPRPPAGADIHAEIATRILESCDILVAVFDGGSGNGPGGTADIVARASSMGRPIVIIQPQVAPPESAGARLE